MERYQYNLNNSEYILGFLKQNGIEFTKLTQAETEAHKQEWFYRFVPLKKRKTIMKMLRGRHNIRSWGTYLWQAFYWELIDCFKYEKARTALDEIIKSEAVMLLNPNSIAYRISDASKITSEHLETLFDVILTSYDFTWTYAKTSEKNAGPYFCIIEE